MCPRVNLTDLTVSWLMEISRADDEQTRCVRAGIVDYVIVAPDHKSFYGIAFHLKAQRVSGDDQIGPILLETIFQDNCRLRTHLRIHHKDPVSEVNPDLPRDSAVQEHDLIRALIANRHSTGRNIRTDQSDPIVIIGQDWILQDWILAKCRNGQCRQHS